MAKTGSERVREWRIRNLRKFYRTEILLSREDAAKLDMRLLVDAAKAVGTDLT